MGRKKSSFNKGDSLVQNRNFNYSRLYSHFSLLAKNRFKWSNLPKHLESRHIEQMLYEHGQVAFYDDEVLGVICLPSSPSNNLNIYGDAKQFTLTGKGQHYSKLVTEDEIVRVLANDNAIPVISDIIYYTDLLEEIERVMYINLNQQKIPFIIPTTKNNELSMKKLYEKVEDGELAIFVDEKLNHGVLSNENTIKTNAPYLLDKLQATKNEVMIELLTFLGLNNTNVNKKERLLVDEVNVNNSAILMNLEIEYKNRLEACKKINEKFGLNVTVEKVVDKLQADFFGKDNKETD